MILILCQDIKKGEKSRRVRESIREQVGFELDLKGQGRVSGNRKQMGRHLRWREQQEAKLGVGLGRGPVCAGCVECVWHKPQRQLCRLLSHGGGLGIWWWLAVGAQGFGKGPHGRAPLGDDLMRLLLATGQVTFLETHEDGLSG